MFRRSLAICLVSVLAGCNSVTGGAPGSEPTTRPNIDCDLIFPAPGGM
jgi:hypothetical protein